MALEDELKNAREAAQILKDALGVKDLPATPESTQEMEAGSPRTPGYDEHSGKTMKSAFESQAEVLAEASPLKSNASIFEQALEALPKSQKHEESKEQDRGNDFDC